MSQEIAGTEPGLLDRMLDLPSLKELPRRKIARNVAHLEALEIPSGSEIFARGAMAEYLYWVLDGEILLQGASGEHFVSSGETFGEESIQAGGVYVEGAVAWGNATVVRIEAARARDLFSDSKSFRSVLTRLMRRITGDAYESEDTATEEPEKTGKPSGQDWFSVTGWLATIFAPLILFFWGRGSFGEGNQLVFLCIALATILMWAFRLMNEFIPSIFAVLSILILNIAPADVALVGFTDGSFYLALSIFGLSSLIVSSGLAFRMVLWMLHIVPISSRWHAWSLFWIGTILTPLLPSANGRVALMMPVLKDLVESSGYGKGSKSATYLFMSGFAGFTMLSTIFLSSKTIHFVIFGLLPQQVKERFSWSYWLYASAAAGVVLILGLYFLLELFSKNREKPEITRSEIRMQHRAFGPMSLSEWAALGGVMLFIVGISTASLHKIQLPWIGLLVLYATLAIGFLSPKEFRLSTDWTFLLYLGSLIGFVSTISHLGLDRQVGSAFSWMGNYMKNDFPLFVLILSGTVIFLRFFVPTNTVVAILASVLFPMAQALGVNPWIVGFILLMLSDVWFFPYQCTYYVQIEPFIGSDSHFNLRQFYLFNSVSNILRVLALFVSIPFWKWLGLL